MHDRESAARLFRHARREAVVILLVWALALAWTVGWCYLRGYRHEPDSWAVQAGWAVVRMPQDVQHFGGIPDWVVQGVLAPWLVCTLCTLGFGLFVMKDDDLGTEVEEDAARGH
jgi:hypothetical protein